MPRPPRLHVKGVLYYVTQQGAHDQPLFRSEADTAHYLELLCQYKIKHRFNLFAYSLLPERIALLIEPLSDTTISEIMRDLTSRYSKYYNSEYGGTGPLFKGRFRTSIAEKEGYLGTLVRFLHTQPALASVSGSANPVWASSRDLFLPEPGAQTLPMREAMLGELAELEAHLREAGVPNETITEFMNTTEMGNVENRLSKPFMGSPGFMNRVKEELAEASTPKKSEEQTPVFRAAVKTAPAGTVRSMVLVFTLLACGGFYFTSEQMNFFNTEKSPLPPAESPVNASVRIEEAEPRSSLNVQKVVLDGSSWDVRIIPMEKGEKVAIENDALIFSENKVISRLLAEKGFTPTNYNLTVNPDGKITWETMQRSESGEVVSWRGEWRGEEMKGVMSYRVSENKPKNFNFVGVLRGGGHAKS